VGSTYGQFFRIATFGESHRPGVGVLVDGCPLQAQLDQRRPAQSKLTVRKPSGFGRCRMLPLTNGAAASLHPFVSEHVEPGAKVITDAWQGYHGLEKLGYVHERRSQRAVRAAGEDPGELLPAVHRVASLAKAVDLSFASLKGVHEGYRLAVQADAMALPFRDASYDAIVSTYFWEHIRPEDKPPMLAEFRRVLRPGGRMVFLFDVASQNPLFRWFRRSPELYRECIVENDHHYGLESPEANLAHFEAAGFRVLAKHLANKTPIQHLPVYAWARAYDHPITNAASRLAGIVSARPILNRAYAVGVTLFDDLVEPLFPNDWARIMLVALEREAG